MPTYVQTADNSNRTPSWSNTSVFDKDMFTGAGTPSNFTVTIPASSTRSASFITVTGVPNSDAWEDGGTQTVELDVNMGDADFTGKCRIVRLDTDGNIEESGSFTGTQAITTGANLTFSPVSPTWETAGDANACGDRIAIEWEFVNSDTHNHSLKLDIRVTTAEVITDITENGGTCMVTAVDHPDHLIAPHSI